MARVMYYTVGKPHPLKETFRYLERGPILKERKQLGRELSTFDECGARVFGLTQM